MLEAGMKAPSFKLPTSNGNDLAVPTGGPMVLYFYPKDDTPGCTTEAIEFSARKNEFANLGVTIVGVSPDPIKKHDKFIAKHSLTIPLVADEEKTALEAYGVWVEKQMYGKTYMGVERATFLISADGDIVQVWRKVRVKGHVDAVLDAAQQHFG